MTTSRPGTGLTDSRGEGDSLRRLTAAWRLDMPAGGPEVPLPEGRGASEGGEGERDVRPAASAGFPMERRTVSKVRSIFLIDRDRISCFLVKKSEFISYRAWNWDGKHTWSISCLYSTLQRYIHDFLPRTSCKVGHFHLLNTSFSNVDKPCRPCIISKSVLAMCAHVRKRKLPSHLEPLVDFCFPGSSLSPLSVADAGSSSTRAFFLLSKCSGGPCRFPADDDDDLEGNAACKRSLGGLPCVSDPCEDGEE